MHPNALTVKAREAAGEPALVAEGLKGKTTPNTPPSGRPPASTAHQGAAY
jgi:hypothetical protein